MEKKKNKKKLFAIIGGSVLAFVLTIALSVSITLAYFGNNAAGSSSITMGGSVVLNDQSGSKLVMAQAITGVVPGQTVNFSAQGIVGTSSSQYAAAAMLVKTSTAEGTADAKLTALVTGLTAKGWVRQGTETITVTGTNAGTYDVYVYAGVETDATKTDGKLEAISLAKDTPVTLTFAGTVEVPTEWRNDMADKSVTLDCMLVVVQNGEDSATISERKEYTALKDIFTAVASYADPQDTTPAA